MRRLGEVEDGERGRMGHSRTPAPLVFFVGSGGNDDESFVTWVCHHP